MMKNKNWVIVLLMMFCLCFIPSSQVEAKWVKTSKGYRYTKNASGTKYYKNNWVKIKGKYYYFDKKGYRKTGWLSYQGNKYYLDKNGVRLTGVQNIDNKSYFFSKKGIMICGWIKHNNQYYYANDKGELQKGLVGIGNYAYYFDAEGKRVSGGNIVLGNITYYFATNGTLQYTGTAEERAVKYINVVRMLNGMEPLVYYETGNLANATNVRAKELAVNKSHTRPNNTNYGTILTSECPVSTYWNGECILWGTEKAGEDVAKNWLSDGNANVLLQKQANGISVSRYVDNNGCEYWDAIVVQIP